MWTYNSFTVPPHLWKLPSRSILQVKEECTSFADLPQWSKLLCRPFVEFKEACTSFTTPQDRSFLTLKLASTSFTGLPQWSKLPSRSSQHSNRCGWASQGLNSGKKMNFGSKPWHSTRREQASQVQHYGETAFNIFPDTQTGPHKPFHHSGGSVKLMHACLSVRRTMKGDFTTVEVSWSFIIWAWKIQKAGFTTVEVLWLLSESILTFKQGCTSFTRPPQWWKLPSESFWNSNRCARDFHNVEKFILNLFWHTNWREQAAQDRHMVRMAL